MNNETIINQAPRLLQWLSGIPAEQWQYDDSEDGWIDFVAKGWDAYVSIEGEQCNLHSERASDGMQCDFSGTWSKIFDEIFTGWTPQPGVDSEQD